MLSCKEVTELASRALDAPLPLSQRIGMRLHLFICKHCTRYVKQLKFMHRVLGEFAREETEQHITLPEQSRRRIHKRLREDPGRDDGG